MRKFVRVVPHTEVLTTELLMKKGYDEANAKEYAGGVPQFWGLTVTTENDIRKYLTEEKKNFTENNESFLFEEMYDASEVNDVKLETALWFMSFVPAESAFYDAQPRWLELKGENKC